MAIDEAALQEGTSGRAAPGFGDLPAELYQELRSIAARQYRYSGSPATLQPTALVGEAYLRLRERSEWASESHFLGCAATAMRHVLVDAARARLAAKRNGGERASLTVAMATLRTPDTDEQLVKLADALVELDRFEPLLAKLVEYRFFVGLDEVETARQMDLSDRTVRRWWVRARAWIHAEMARPD